MSYVSIYRIDDRNVFHNSGEARNAHAFHVSIWRHLGIKHHDWKDDWSWWSFREPGPGDPLEKLWAGIGNLPRLEGLAMAATFDRCWFPWALLDETIVALFEISPHASTAGEAAAIMREWKGQSRGFTFASSLASSWHCSALGEDEDSAGRSHHHIRFGKNERACRHAGCSVADIDNAAMLVKAR